jgi:flagellar motor switch protein FliM
VAVPNAKQPQPSPAQTLRSVDARVAAKPLDFRVPASFAPSFLTGFEESHHDFAEILSESLSRELHTPVQVRHLSTEQLSYDTYVRSMPNPSLLTILEPLPLPGTIIFELSTQLGLVMVDRLLGGPGRPVAPRPPTQLELTLLGGLTRRPPAALREAFTKLVDLEPRLLATETNPQAAEIAAPTDTVLVLTFSVIGNSGESGLRGLLSLCYSPATAAAIRDLSTAATRSPSKPQNPLLEAATSQASVELALRTVPTSMPASEILQIRPGDVVMLDHKVAEPLVGLVEGIPFMRMAIGRRDGELATRLERWNDR